MSERSLHLADSLLEEFAEICLMALKNEGGIYPTQDERDKLKEALMEALRGKVRI